MTFAQTSRATTARCARMACPQPLCQSEGGASLALDLYEACLRLRDICSVATKWSLSTHRISHPHSRSLCSKCFWTCPLCFECLRVHRAGPVFLCPLCPTIPDSRHRQALLGALGDTKSIVDTSRTVSKLLIRVRAFGCPVRSTLESQSLGRREEPQSVRGVRCDPRLVQPSRISSWPFRKVSALAFN